MTWLVSILLLLPLQEEKKPVRLSFTLHHLDTDKEREQVKNRFGRLPAVAKVDVADDEVTLTLKKGRLRLSRLRKAAWEAERWANGSRVTPKKLKLDEDTVIVTGRVRLVTLATKRTDEVLKALRDERDIARAEAVKDRLGEFDIEGKGVSAEYVAAVLEPWAVRNAGGKKGSGRDPIETKPVLTDILWTIEEKR